MFQVVSFIYFKEEVGAIEIQASRMALLRYSRLLSLIIGGFNMLKEIEKKREQQRNFKAFVVAAMAGLALIK